MAVIPHATPKRRWWTLSLRALMVLVAAVAGWLAWESNRAQRVRSAIEAIVRDGGQVLFDDKIADDGDLLPVRQTPSAWRLWAMRTVGYEYLARVRHVSFGDSRGGRGRRLAKSSWDALANLPDLAHLELGDCDVGDDDLERCRGFTHLGFLNLSSNPRISDAGLAHLGGLRRLWHLDLSGTRVGDAGLAHLKPLRGLRYLDASSAGVSNAGVAHLQDLTSLDTLYLAGARVDDAGLKSLRNRHELRRLGLGGTLVSDAGVAELLSLEHLTELHLNLTRVTSAGLATVGRMPALTTLSLAATRVDDAGIAHLKNLDRLEVLFLDQTQVTDASIPVLKQMPNLGWLTLEDTLVTPQAARALKQARPELILDP